MMLMARFVVPLLFSLILFALALSPLVDRLVDRWFQNDVELRSQLVFNSIHDAVADLLSRQDLKGIKALFRSVTLDERLLAVLPLFHINALLYSLCGALAAGATYVLAPRFSASTFWPLVVQSGATLVNTIAAITTILLKRPASEFIPVHSLRKLYGAPLTAEMTSCWWMRQ